MTDAHDDRRVPSANPTERPAPAYLHIGTMKTGTSYIQGNLERLSPDLAAAGIYYPGNVGAAVHDVLERRGARASFGDTAGAWADLARSVRQWPAGPAVISMEFLTLATVEQIREITTSLRPREVRVILTVRDLGRTIPSAWQQTTKNRQTTSWADFLQLIRASAPQVGTALDAPREPDTGAAIEQDDTVRSHDRLRSTGIPYTDADLDVVRNEGASDATQETRTSDTRRRSRKRHRDTTRPAAAFWAHHEIVSTIERWSSVVGASNICLVIVPPSGAPKDLLWKRFCTAADIDPAAYTPRDNVRPNTSLGFAEAEMMRRLNVELGRGVDQLTYRTLVTGFLSRQVLRRAAEPTSAPALPLDVVDWVNSRSQATVAALAALPIRVIGDLSELVPSPAAPARPPAAPDEADVAAAAIRAVAALVTRLADSGGDAEGTRAAQAGRRGRTQAQSPGRAGRVRKPDGNTSVGRENPWIPEG